MLCGSAFKNKGVQAMLDAVIEFMPSPMEMPPVKGMLDDGTEGTRARQRRREVRRARVQDPERPVRRQPDVLPRLFRRAELRRHRHNPGKDRKERIGRLLQMHANERSEIKEVRAGDIAAAVGLKDVIDRRHAVRPGARDPLEKMLFPEPVISRRRRAEDQGRPGKDGSRAATPREGRPFVPRVAPTRSPARRSSPAWASCTSRSSSTA